jgi:hypothetical protein
MTQRHDAVQSRAIEATMKYRGLQRTEISENCTVNVGQFEDLKKVDLRESSKLRSDVSFWNLKKKENKVEFLRLLLI